MPTVYSPPVSTYVALQTITLGASASSVTFSSIPATYRDLVCVVAGQATGNSSIIAVINSDTTGHYSYVRMEGDGSSTNSASSSVLAFAVVGRISGSVESTNVFTVMDYSATDKHKTILGRGDAPNDRTRAVAARWPSTSAVTSLEVKPDGQSFDSGATISLYGIEA